VSRTKDAIIHLREARHHLLLEAYRVDLRGNESREDHFTIAEELSRIDTALGPRGSSMFAGIADSVRSAYVEIQAALQALEGSRP
jgi:hypothetical protein